jgi:N-acetylglucosaminyldiphosphoundecaprenol N-acetyl-beta-D-mannosaminyltransferase
MDLQMDKVDILGVPVDVIDRTQLLSKIDELAMTPGVSLVNNVNAHACNLAFSDPDFHQILSQSDVVFCDGFGVKLAAKMRGKTLGERMTPPDWIDELFELCSRKRYTVYFLGDTREVVSRFSEKVQQKHSHLRVVGCHDGFFNMNGDDASRVFNELVRLRPDIILTGMGMPRQEKWAWRARQRIGKGVIVATGALFRWYTGIEHRGPHWMTQFGLEWLSRLAVSPVRHFKRYVIGLPLFFFRIVTYRPAKSDDE